MKFFRKIFWIALIIAIIAVGLIIYLNLSFQNDKLLNVFYGVLIISIIVVVISLIKFFNKKDEIYRKLYFRLLAISHTSKIINILMCKLEAYNKEIIKFIESVSLEELMNIFELYSWDETIDYNIQHVRLIPIFKNKSNQKDIILFDTIRLSNDIFYLQRICNKINYILLCLNSNDSEYSIENINNLLEFEKCFFEIKESSKYLHLMSLDRLLLYKRYYKNSSEIENSINLIDNFSTEYVESMFENIFKKE